MKTIIKILVIFTMTFSIHAQDTIERIPASMEQIDTLIEDRGTDYSQLFGDDFDTEYETEPFNEKSFYGFSIVEYEHYSGKSYTAKISYRRHILRRFMFGYNGSFYYVPNKETNMISYAVPYVSCVATWLPVVTNTIDVAIDFEVGMGHSMNYHSGLNETAPYISIGAGSDIHFSNNSLITLRSSLGLIAANNIKFQEQQQIKNYTIGNSSVPFFSFAIGIHLSEIKYNKEQE
jgi:hypothetical protein